MEAPDSVAAMIALSAKLAREGHLPATSGNFSARAGDARMVVTASGGDKGALTREDFIELSIHDPAHPRASAEAPLHAALYRARPEAGAIAHVHGQSAILASLIFAKDGAVILQGFELQKALLGITSHQTTVRVPIFANDQDMVALGHRVEAELGDGRAAWGLLLEGHGLYVWGRAVKDAGRHVDALDALFKTLLALKGIPA